MKVILFGPESPKLAELVKKHGLTMVDQHPEVVISYGGDGTLLRSEQHFPGVPKLPLRRSDNCFYCAAHQPEVMIAQLTQGKLIPRQFVKLETSFGNQPLLALNEIGVFHKMPFQALRFRVVVEGKEATNTVIGDGVIVASPFGSTGYFKSMGGEPFDHGLAISFSNPVVNIKPIYIDELAQVQVKILRGPGVLTNDNNQNFTLVDSGDAVLIKASDQKAILLTDSLRCPSCERVML